MRAKQNINNLIHLAKKARAMIGVHTSNNFYCYNREL